MQNLKLQLKIENFKVESGNVLLLALLVMAGIMTAGLAIGSIILNEIRQARNIDFASAAYFAAESGVEQALYKFRKEDAVIICPAGICDENGFCTLGDRESCIRGNGNLSNQSSWTRTVADKEWQIYEKIKKDESLQVDLFDPSGTSAAGVESIKIEWTPECVPPATSMIEVAYIAWNPSVGWVAGSEQRFKYSVSASPVINNGFSSTRSYRVRIKAFYCDISNLIVTAWGENDAIPGSQVQIPARVVLNSVGSFSNLRQAVKMTMPRKSPMSGLYDFVLFTECSLVKGEEATCP